MGVCPQCYALLMLNQALARDNFQCMITGLFNQNSVEHNAKAKRLYKVQGGLAVTIETCHILSESVMQGVESNDSKVCTVL